MLPTILIIVAVVIVLLAIIVSRRPDEFRVTRSIRLDAPAAVAFEQVNDLAKWQGWSPWENIDPALQRTYEGPASGAGAIYRWTGNRKIGAGVMTITESRPPELIRFRLDFLKPYKSTNETEFTFKSEGNQTVVTWTMTGECKGVAKVFGLLMNMDKMIGGQFDQGLANLKSLVEATEKW